MSVASPMTDQKATGFGLRSLVFAVVVAALAIGASAMALVGLKAFERSLLMTVDSRLAEVATEIARNVENGLQAGVPLEQQRRLLAVMADEKAQAPDLTAIRLTDERGVILFSTNEAEIGEPDAVASHRGLGATTTEEKSWRRVGNDAIVFGLPLTGLFGEGLGTVTVELPKTTVDAQRERFALGLVLAVTAVTVIAGAIAAVVLAAVPLPASRRLAALCQRLDRLYVAAAGAEPAILDQPLTPSSKAITLGGPLGRFERWLAPRLRHLTEREAELRRLDESA